MSYITKESVYELLENFEQLYPEAAAAFRVAVAEMPEELVRCKECKLYGNCLTEDTFKIARIEAPFCCAGTPKEGAE